MINMYVNFVIMIFEDCIIKIANFMLNKYSESDSDYISISIICRI